MKKYSYSRVKSFDNCPFYFYRHYYEVPEREDPSVWSNHGMSEFGSFCHSILEDYLSEKIGISDVLSSYEDGYSENVKSSFDLKISENFSRNFYDSYYNDGVDYFSSFIGFPEYKVLEVEMEFEEVIDNSFIFIGKIDLVAEDQNGDLIVLDHKSKASFKNKAEKCEYARQLYLYSYAVMKKYGRFPKKLVFNMFRKQDWVEIEFNEDDYKESFDWLSNSIQNIESEFEFSPIPNTFFCWNFCGYRNARFQECLESGLMC